MYLYVTFAGPCCVFLSDAFDYSFSSLVVVFISQGFLFFFERQPWLPSYFFSTAPRYLHRISSAKRSTGQGKRQDRPPLSVFLRIIMIGSRYLQFVISEPTPRKRKLDLGGFMTDRAAFIFSTSLDIITRFMVLRLRERRT